MKNFECKICGNDSYKIIKDSSQIRFKCYGYEKYIISCDNCSIYQLYPQWTENELEQLYEKYSKKKDFEDQKIKSKPEKYIEEIIKKSESKSFCNRHGILEIGCGKGNTLEYLRNKGYNAIGIDKDKSIINNRNYIVNSDIEDFSGLFGFIYSIHVFEHFNDPFELIMKIDESLVQNGIFVLEVPNREDPLLSLYKNKAYDNFYWYPYHSYFYNFQEIENMFGLRARVYRKQRYGIINHLRWILFGKPGNINFNIPILDNIYKYILVKVFKKSDTIVVIGRENARY